MSHFKFTADTRKLHALAVSMPIQADKGLRMAGEEMANEMRLSMGTSPAGRTYTRRDKVHVASAPGNPPNPDMNSLRASVRLVPDGRLRYQITDGVEHGLWMEVGTETIEPRPWMIPVVEVWRAGKFQELLAGQLG